VPKVLEGIRVADFTQIMGGSSGTMFLADLGADVVKVENTELGDFARVSLPFLFESVNRSKRSLSVDLGTDRGIEIARRLALSSDVVVQGYRPGALAKKGLGPTDLRDRNPRLIYLSLSGFGAEGPGQDRRGIDQLIQVESGMAAVMDGVNQRLGLVDAAAGIAIGQAALAALFRREREGVGSEIEVTLYDTALWLQMLPIAEYSVTRVPPQVPSEYELRIPTMGVFETVDGRVFMAILNETEWLGLCEVLGRPEWVDDPRFADRANRTQHGGLLRSLIADAVREFDKAALIAAGERRQLMISSVKDYDDVFADPQAAVNESFDTILTADGADLVQVRGPYRFLGEEVMARPPRRAPRLGEDSDEVIAQLGYTDDEVAALRRDGVVAGS
jgi:crotonobetainyl-CoA:carnitine CoA-transferase CaiB-like acyl-CoA transferase